MNKYSFIKTLVSVSFIMPLVLSANLSFAGGIAWIDYETGKYKCAVGNGYESMFEFCKKTDSAFNGGKYCRERVSHVCE